jgi:hypothetical protein
MAVEAAVRFLEATSADESMRASLAALIGVGDGDVSTAEALDEAEAEALLGERGVLVARFAEEQGYAFSVAELATVVDAFQRHKAGDLPDGALPGALGIESSGAQMAAAARGVDMVYFGIRYQRMPMAAADPLVLQFARKTAEDPALREGLLSILQTGDGDISSFAELDADEAQALLSERGALVAAFAAHHGFAFTLADLFAVMDAFNRVKRGEMTEDAFAKYVQSAGGSDSVLPYIENVAEFTYKGFSYQTAVPSGAQAGALQVVRFMEKSRTDAELGAALQTVIGGDGDISSPSELDAREAQSLVGDRSARIVELGTEHGFRFTVADLSAVVGAFRLVGSGDLPLESCMRILGMKPAEQDTAASLAAVASTAGRIYRGIRY